LPASARGEKAGLGEDITERTNRLRHRDRQQRLWTRADVGQRLSRQDPQRLNQSVGVGGVVLSASNLEREDNTMAKVRMRSNFLQMKAAQRSTMYTRSRS
jgi:hypothetical protein